MILVTGDVVLDHNLYSGQRFTPDSVAVPGMLHRTEAGGATLTYGLLTAMERAASATQGRRFSGSAVMFGIKESTADALRNWPHEFKAGAVWDPYAGAKKGDRYWRISKQLGFGGRESVPYPASPAPGLDIMKPQVLVVDDGGLGFRLKTASRCWPRFLRSADKAPEPQWIILKMSRPLARGDLWRNLADRWHDRLIVLVNADNLRREGVSVSRGLSWESAVDDLVKEIHSNPAIGGLKSCRHLVITLQGDAALWLERPGSAGHAPCRLVFDRERGEGEWEDSHKDGEAYGYLSAVTAALAWNLKAAKAADAIDLVPALKAGLSTMRFLRDRGHGKVDDGEPGFPYKEAAQHLLVSAANLPPNEKHAASNVQCSGACCKGTGPVAEYWTMLGELAHSNTFPGPLFGPARRLALLGPKALESIPCARFGKLLTLDRREIEALRTMRQLMLSYKNVNPQKQPLSLAVFGAPGSGKSFGLKQIAEGIFGEKNPMLEFNLSQFKGPEDLIGAYHQVRDKVLAGYTPVVFWDEFDSRQYQWLQYLLAPMQDGTFQDGQLTHNIGKSIFVFAGGTSFDFEHFGPPDKKDAVETESQQKDRKKFVMAKGPDFKSRLAGYFDVLGPNPKQMYINQNVAQGLDPWVDDSTDSAFPVRRAILLRSLLDLVKEDEDKPLDIDLGLLTALLEVGHYRNGARSLEKLVLQMKDRGGLPLQRSYLPPDNLLALYVDDVKNFHALIRRSYEFLAQAEKLAPALHEDWRAHLTRKEKRGPYNVPYERLDQEGKAANVAAASRIPEILALVGFVLEEGDASKAEDTAVARFIRSHLELLAEAEHQGWELQKRMEGWVYGPPPKDSKKRTHPLFGAYSDLPEKEKKKDRRTIANYPKYARQTGFKIVSQRTNKP